MPDSLQNKFRKDTRQTYLADGVVDEHDHRAWVSVLAAHIDRDDAGELRDEDIWIVASGIEAPNFEPQVA